MRRGFSPSLPAAVWDKILEDAFSVGGEAACARAACVCKDAALAQEWRPRSNAVRVSPVSKKVWEPAAGHFDVTVPADDAHALELALEACPLGGSMLLLPGTHGRMLVTKPIHVFGRGQATVHGIADYSLRSTAPTATVDGVSFLGPPIPVAPELPRLFSAVWICSGGMRVQSCVVTCSEGGIGIQIGAFIFGREDGLTEAEVRETVPVIQDCEVHNCRIAAVGVGAASSWCVQRCRLHHNGSGVSVDAVNLRDHDFSFTPCEPKLLNNRIYHNRLGISVRGAFHTLYMEGNRVSNIVHVVLAGSKMVDNHFRTVCVDKGCCDMVDNRINKHMVYSDGATGRMEDCVVGGGVTIEGGARPTLVGNRVFGTTCIFGATTEGRIDHNALSTVAVCDGADPIVCHNTVKKTIMANTLRGIFFGNTLLTAEMHAAFARGGVAVAPDDASLD